MTARPQIVVLGMMTKIPVAGVVWQTLHYLIGLERLGYETYYVEAHARTPSMLMERADDDSSARAASFLARVLVRFGFGERWAFHALHADGRCYGLSQDFLHRIYRSAALIINLHGGTEPRPEHTSTDRLVYVGTDPVDVEIQLAQGRKETADYLQPHCAFFTFGENYGQPDCRLPFSPRFAFHPTRQPVALDFWQRRGHTPGERFTTIGNWRQEWRDLNFAGETYSWSKHQQFLKFIELPNRVGPRFELALAGCEESDRRLLESHGWRVKDALPLSLDLDVYRDYITTSHGEFTVAKDQNVRLRTGWFSDRAATYLAAGRPVITQDTGFGSALPTGEGLFAFTTLGDIVAAIESIEADYERHSRAADQIAREYFDAGRVLGRLLEEVGLPRLPPSLVIAPVSRRPTRLPDESVRAVLEAPLPVPIPAPEEANQPDVSVVVVTFGGLVFTRLCLESVLASIGLPAFELIVVDNGSTDGTVEYLHRLEERNSRVRLITNGRNLGFAAAVNIGLAAARGRLLVVLNNDVIVPPGALRRLLRHLDDRSVGMVGPVSNEAATEGEIDIGYETYAGLMSAAKDRAAAEVGRQIDVPMLTMFCIALRREVYERVGPLDERFEVGLFEDDDYSMRVRNVGYSIVCAEDTFVHHFGEGAFGALVPTGEAAVQFNTNLRVFEEKWSTRWQPHGRRRSEQYHQLVERIRAVVNDALPSGSSVLVVSKGDDDLLRFEGHPASHFPQYDGIYAGHHPADSGAAIHQLETLRERGADFLLFPGTSLWWLDHYGGFREHLDARYHRVLQTEDCVIFDLTSASLP